MRFEGTVITGRQIRAGRNLLGLTQAELASRAGLSTTGLNNIERNQAKARHETLQRIAKELTDDGLEFTDGEGVRLSLEVLSVSKHIGDDAIEAYCKDQREQIRPNGDVIMFGLDNTHWVPYFSEVSKLMVWLEENNVRERALVRNREPSFSNLTNKYRWMTEDMFGVVDFTVYANTVAFLIWTNPVKLILIRNASLADSYRKQFDFFWENSEAISATDFKKGLAKWHALNNGAM